MFHNITQESNSSNLSIGRPRLKIIENSYPGFSKGTYRIYMLNQNRERQKGKEKQMAQKTCSPRKSCTPRTLPCISYTIAPRDHAHPFGYTCCRLLYRRQELFTSKKTQKKKKERINFKNYVETLRVEHNAFLGCERRLGEPFQDPLNLGDALLDELPPFVERDRRLPMHRRHTLHSHWILRESEP